MIACLLMTMRKFFHLNLVIPTKEQNLRKWKKDLRKETWQQITFQDLMELVNSGKATLELISTLSEFSFMRLECWLKYAKNRLPGQFLDCCICLMSKRVFYEWNDPEDPHPYS